MKSKLRLWTGWDWLARLVGHFLDLVNIPIEEPERTRIVTRWSDDAADVVFALEHSHYVSGSVSGYFRYRESAAGNLEKAKKWAAHYNIVLPNDELRNAARGASDCKESVQ